MKRSIFIGLAVLAFALIIIGLLPRSEKTDTTRDPEAGDIAISSLENADSMKVFTLVDEKPRFPGCEDIKPMNEKQSCAQQELLEYLYSNIRYPAEARKNKIEGRTIIQFVVEKDGWITNARIVRDLGGGCGDEALRVVRSMNGMEERWIPGRVDGEAVRTQYTLPVVFRLE